MTTKTPEVLVELCRQLRLPSVSANAMALAAEATQGKSSMIKFLTKILEVEKQDRSTRRAARRQKEADFPKVKTLEGFDFSRAPHLPEPKIRTLSNGQYIDEAESVLLIGEPGTGKTHIALALGHAATEQGRRVRFTTAARLVNELAEAKDSQDLGRTVARYSRIELLIVDELGYLPLKREDAEFLFQVLTERDERQSLIVTTNLPFGEWNTVFPDPRLCRAVVDRLTHRSTIIDTGKDSGRLTAAKDRARRRNRSRKPKPTKPIPKDPS